MSVETNRHALETSLNLWFSARDAFKQSGPVNRPLGQAIARLSHEDAARLAETACHVYGYEKQTGRDIFADYKAAAAEDLSADQHSFLQSTEVLRQVVVAANGYAPCTPQGM